MTILVQTGKGNQAFSFPQDLVYYTRIYTVRTRLFIPSNYNGDVFLGVVNRYHKIGQILFLFEGYVIRQAFLEYTQQDWGCYLPRRDVDLPIFIEPDGITFDDSFDNINKHLTPNTQYSPSNGVGRLNFINMIRDTLLGVAQDLVMYELANTWRLFAKYKPGLYNQMPVVDQIVIESFRDDIVIELECEGLR